MSENVIILSPPRSGSSLLCNIIKNSGFNCFVSDNSNLIGPSEFNPDGYFEDNYLSLLNDQIIRNRFGLDYSFLHAPAFGKPAIRSEFSYDIDNSTLFIPKGFASNVESFTGVNWDNWGLTRMTSGKKWYKCYSKNNLQTGKEIKNAIEEFSNQIKSSKNKVIKDPRLAFTIDLLGIKKAKYIYLKRDHKSHLKSMRRHYGKNIFTELFFDSTNFCSNHFNYKIKFQKYESYIARYDKFIRDYIDDKSFLEISYEDILNRNCNSLKEFLNIDLNLDCIR